MTPNEDLLLDRLSGSAKLTLTWQLLAILTCFILAQASSGFYFPMACSAVGAALSLIEINYTIPRLRRQVWEAAPLETYHCLRCDQDVVVGRCACTESPSPWTPKP